MNVAVVNDIIFAQMQKHGWYYGASREARFNLPKPHQINNGMCEDWALKAQELFGGDAIWLDTFKTCADWRHCVLLLNGRYYDSIHPDGARTLRQFRQQAREYFKQLRGGSDA